MSLQNLRYLIKQIASQYLQQILVTIFLKRRKTLKDVENLKELREIIFFYLDILLKFLLFRKNKTFL